MCVCVCVCVCVCACVCACVRACVHLLVQIIKIKAQNVLFSMETITVTSLNNKKLQKLNYSPKHIQYTHIYFFGRVGGREGLEFSISLPNTEINN